MPDLPDPLAKLIGRSPLMREVRAQIRQIAESHVPVLVTGETGTGKELCAEGIGRLSGRTPFIAVNCAAIPEHLVESELFGHVRGAFTGAVSSRIGLIAAADGGTLFLDELNELPVAVQAKLLRTLESGEYRPVGAIDGRRSDFRILAATSEDVEGLVASGQLRAPLLHRLGAVRLRLPALRDRLADIPPLAEEFLCRYRTRSDCGPTRIASEACAVLMQYQWPGNVRQLRNVVEAAAAVAGSEPTVGLTHALQFLPPLAPDGAPLDQFPTLAEVRLRAERRAILQAIHRAEGNRQRARRRNRRHRYAGSHGHRDEH